MSKTFLFLIIIFVFVSCKNRDDDSCATREQRLREQVLIQARLINQLEDSLHVAIAGHAKEQGAPGITAADTAAAMRADGHVKDTPDLYHGYYKIGAHHVTKVKSGGIIYGQFPEGSSKVLTVNDVKFMSQWGLKVMLNEIYARHGMRFTDPELQNHFSRQKWYHAVSADGSRSLTPMEKKNIEFLSNYKLNSQEAN